MPDKKLTDSEIPNVKELLEYKVKGHCELCNFKNSDCCGVCMYTAIKQFIELFNHLQAENENYSKNNRQMTSDILKLYKDLEQAKAENEKLKTNEERYNRIYHLLLDPLIVANGKNGELRPVKRTSRQDVYHTLLRAQEIMEIPYRWFPWKKDGDNK